MQLRSVTCSWFYPILATESVAKVFFRAVMCYMHTQLRILRKQTRRKLRGCKSCVPDITCSYTFQNRSYTLHGCMYVFSILGSSVCHCFKTHYYGTGEVCSPQYSSVPVCSFDILVRRQFCLNISYLAYPIYFKVWHLQQPDTCAAKLGWFTLKSTAAGWFSQAEVYLYACYLHFLSSQVLVLRSPGLELFRSSFYH